MIQFQTRVGVLQEIDSCYYTNCEVEALASEAEVSTTAKHYETKASCSRLKKYSRVAVSKPVAKMEAKQ